MAARFSIAPFGPMHLRRLLRARMEPGEHLVGFAIAQLKPSPARLVAQVGLALIPGLGQVAAIAISVLAQDQRRVVVLTSRRLLLLRPDRSGPSADGRGVVADLPLGGLVVSCAPAPVRTRPVAPPARGRLRRARRRRASRAQVAAQVSTFTLSDPTNSEPGSLSRVDLVLPHGPGGATARLREALVLLAENPPAAPPYNQVPPTRGHGPQAPTPARRDGILSPDRAPQRRSTHPRMDRRRIQE